MEPLTIAIVLLFMVLLYLKSKKPNKNFPPGPSGYPIIGNLLSILNTQPHKKMHSWSKTYGSVTGLYIGSQPVVILNDWTAVKEAFITQGDNFSGRHNNAVSMDYCRGYGIILTEGHLWKEQRRFFLRSMRDFGFGKKSMESIILEGAEKCVAKIEKLEGNEIDTSHFFNMPIINILWKIVAGKDFGSDDESSNKMWKMMEANFDAFGVLFFVGFFEFLYKSFLLKKWRQRMADSLDATKLLMAGIIREHERMFDPAQINDFIDMYLNEIQKQAGNESTTFNDEQMKMVVMDLFLAGVDSSASLLTWSLLYMCKHKDVQEKVHKEIDQKLGKNTVSMDSRQELVYCEAALMEIHRHLTLAPLAANHRNKYPTELCGFNIPANTMIIPNIYGVHYDGKLWNDPGNYNPDRFIKQGKIYKPEYFIPFSVGKRTCPGEALVRYQVSMIFVAIMQQFSVEFAPGRPQPNFEEAEFAGAMKSPAHSIVFQKRGTHKDRQKRDNNKKIRHKKQIF